MTALIPRPIRCSYNFPGHAPHWEIADSKARKGERQIGERIISVVWQSPESLVVATQSGTVKSYYNHQPKRLVAIWNLYPEAGYLYQHGGLIYFRHKQLIESTHPRFSGVFSITEYGFVSCERVARELAVL